MDELKQDKVQSVVIQRQNRQNVENMEIDLVEIFHVMMQKLWLIILLFVLGAGISYGVTKYLKTPMYSATSQIYILSSTTSITSVADLQLGSQLSEDFGILIKSRPVLEAVIDRMDLDYSYEALRGMLNVYNAGSSRILSLTVTSADPKLAKEIADTLAEEAVDRVAYIMNSDEPKILERAVVPKAPSSPNVQKNTLMGGLVGACLAMGVILLLYLMNDTIQTEEDVRKYLKLNTVAAVPLEKRR